MSNNPDNENYIGLGPQSKMKDSEGNDLAMDTRYLIPAQHQLRFVERGVPTEDPAVLKRVRILQQYQWSQELGTFGWYDIPSVSEEDTTECDG